ncbi:MAG: DNA repair protein RadA [Alphaproteobacteria bacterium]|nr:MAG: DNA repair protein RadA [Alphaproteobacteria bacterium]
MAKPQSLFVCQSCGASAPKWTGRCESCGAWNSLSEEKLAPPVAGAGPRRKSAPLNFAALHEMPTAPAPRLVTGIKEFDRVCGGGLVPGSALLVGGDPGIGKSTLLLQIAARLASQGVACAYVTGEESTDQIRMRAARLGLAQAPVALAASTSVGEIGSAISSSSPPRVAVIDSIQTMQVDGLDSAAGTVGQVRASAQELIRIAKQRGTVLIFVGHVTKEGMIAGPRVLEHMVDTVLYFEGERGHSFRILRAVKNRFGATDEIGVFEMGDMGLAEVANPSALFLADRSEPVPGAAVFAGIEGTRPLLVEIEALVAPSPLGTPRRAVVGWDAGRLAMVLAVLEARCGVAIGPNDVYLNVAGGLRIGEPAADLAVAVAILSALTGEPCPAATVVFGEIGLSGEVRGVGQSAQRLKEAAKLGFTQAILPTRHDSPGATDGNGLRRIPITRLTDLLPLFDANPRKATRAAS